MKDITFIITVLAGISFLYVLAAAVSRRKARPNSEMIDRSGKHWLYLRKTQKGYLFRNPEGKMQTLTNTNIFKGVKF
jgi:hypothetical protein